MQASFSPANGVLVTARTLEGAWKAAQTAGLERLDAQLLLLHALGRHGHDRAWLLTHDDKFLSHLQAETYASLVQRRLAGEPLAYLLGRQAFFGLDLYVDAHVLIPRADTETLVNWALEVVAEKTALARMDILDLGTGSGAIALALAYSLQNRALRFSVTAVDASTAALSVASNNAKRLGLDVNFVSSDWFSHVNGLFDLIVTNPPYVADNDPHLTALRHEPLCALTARDDGLADLHHIIDHAPAHLLPGGWLLLEHGYNQADAVHDRLTQTGWKHVQSRRDLSGIERCTGAQWIDHQ